MLHSYDKKILTLDHDMNFQMKLKMQLLKLGINIDYASNVDEAIKCLQEETPNLIFLELLIPQGKAFEFLKIRSQNSILKKIPVIAVTSCKTKDVFVKAAQLGITDILFKPLNATTLHAKLEKYFSKENQVVVEYKKEPPLVDISFPATMISLGRNLLQVEAPIRISSQKKIFRLQSELFQENEIPVQFMTNVEESKFLTTTKYRSLFYFLGMNQDFSNKIETMAKNPQQSTGVKNESSEPK